MAPGDIPGIEKANPLDPPDLPEGTVPPPGAGFAIPGPSGIPLGPNNVPDPQKNKPVQPQPTPQGMELSLVGDFPNPFRGNAKAELDQVTKGLWFPSTDDFRVVGGSSIVVTDAFSFLLEIMKANKPITRLNFFSHSVTGIIAMQGTIDPAGSVALGTVQNATWTQIFGKTKAIVDPYAKIWGDEGANSGTSTISVGNVTFTLDAVRAKFASDAVFWLYLCHGASDPMLMQQAANVFQVTTKGFNFAIVYCVPSGFPADRHHKLAPQTTPAPVDSCPNAVDNFHKLDSDSTVRTLTPKKP